MKRNTFLSNLNKIQMTINYPNTKENNIYSLNFFTLLIEARFFAMFIYNLEAQINFLVVYIFPLK